MKRLIAAAITFMGLQAHAGSYVCKSNDPDISLSLRVVIDGKSLGAMNITGKIKYAKSAGAVDYLEADLAPKHLKQSWNDYYDLNLAILWDNSDTTEDAAASISIVLRTKKSRTGTYDGQAIVAKSVTAPNLPNPVKTRHEILVICNVEK